MKCEHECYSLAAIIQNSGCSWTSCIRSCSRAKVQDLVHVCACHPAETLTKYMHYIYYMVGTEALPMAMLDMAAWSNQHARLAWQGNQMHAHYRQLVWAHFAVTRVSLATRVKLSLVTTLLHMPPCCIVLQQCSFGHDLLSPNTAPLVSQ
eukprot:scpid30562/ scgid14492/ 